MHKLQGPYYYRNILSVRLYYIAVLHSGHGWLVRISVPRLLYSNVPGEVVCVFWKS